MAPYNQDGVETTARYIGGPTAFYDPHPFRLTLTDSASSREVTLKLGAPSRILTGHISDSETNSPVAATIQISIAGDDEDRWVRFSTSGDGSYRVLVPPNTILNIVIKASDYSTLKGPIAPIDDHIDPIFDFHLTRSK